MTFYKKIWDIKLNQQDMPKFYKGITKIDFMNFKKELDNDNEDFAKKMIHDLIDGKLILIKSAFSDDFVSNLKRNVKKFWKTTPDKFHKILEGCPDFRRIRTPERAKNYSIGAVFDCTYFFPWNSDPCKINSQIFYRWSYIKKLMGLKFDEYQKNTPKDIKVDRMQVCIYPPGAGELETHSDPYHNQRLAISCYLSSLKCGDFSSGGFYCVDEDGNKINLEKEIDVGDLGIFCATVKHGVTAIDLEKSSKDLKNHDWDKGIGRWFIGMGTVDSNETKNRITSISSKKEQFKYLSNN